MPAPAPAPSLTALSAAYDGPAPLALADWRRRIGALYAEVRDMPDPERARQHWLDTRSTMMRDHPMSPLKEDARDDFDGIPVFRYDPALRFEVDVEPVDGDAEEVALGADGSLRRRPVGRTSGLAAALGGELVLWWIEGYGGGLFLPFRDATSGEETYGGGRYVLDTIKGADLGLGRGGRLILDFNFAYNPSCALNDAWTCPLAPPENTLPAPVRGGERWG